MRAETGNEKYFAESEREKRTVKEAVLASIKTPFGTLSFSGKQLTRSSHSFDPAHGRDNQLLVCPHSWYLVSQLWWFPLHVSYGAWLVSLLPRVLGTEPQHHTAGWPELPRYRLWTNARDCIDSILDTVGLLGDEAIDC